MWNLNFWQRNLIIGPLNCLNPETNAWELCGIVSWGLGCAQPGTECDSVNQRFWYAKKVNWLTNYLYDDLNISKEVSKSVTLLFDSELLCLYIAMHWSAQLVFWSNALTIGRPEVFCGRVLRFHKWLHDFNPCPLLYRVPRCLHKSYKIPFLDRRQ